MIPAAAGIQVVGTVLSAAGQLKAGGAAKRAGRERRKVSQFEARQLEQQAGQAVASAQRGAMEEQRRADLMSSRALALAASGGGGVDDPTMVSLFSDIESEGAYRAGISLYQGEEEARKLKMAATAKRMEGEIAARGGEEQQQAYNLAAMGSLIEGASSLYMKYGGGGINA